MYCMLMCILHSTIHLVRDFIHTIYIFLHIYILHSDT